MCPLHINDFSPEVRSDVAEFFAEFEPLVLKISNDYEPELYWSYEADSDCIRQQFQEEDLLYASWEKMGAVMPLQSLREHAEVLFRKSTCLSPAVQLSLDFTYE